MGPKGTAIALEGGQARAELKDDTEFHYHFACHEK